MSQRVHWRACLAGQQPFPELQPLLWQAWLWQKPLIELRHPLRQALL